MQCGTASYKYYRRICVMVHYWQTIDSKIKNMINKYKTALFIPKVAIEKNQNVLKNISGN